LNDSQDSVIFLVSWHLFISGGLHIFSTAARYQRSQIILKLR